MKKKLFLVMMVAMAVLTGCNKKYYFSVSDTQTVTLAASNLTYSEAEGLAFAPNAYDFGDVFGWGTGSNPTLSSSDYSLYGQFDDWGQYMTDNPGWRTLSFEEWNYVLSKRPNADKLRGTATVCDIPGMLLLPDKWTLDTICNSIIDGYDLNVINALKWDTLQNAGAIFLPAAGNRMGTSVQGVRTYGRYWTSTPSAFNCAFFIGFGNEGTDDGTARSNGRSVRLAKVQTSPN